MFRVASRILLWLATSVAGVIGIIVGFHSGQGSVDGMLAWGAFLGAAFGIAGFTIASLIIATANLIDYFTHQRPVAPDSLEADYDDLPRKSPPLDPRP